MSSSGGHTNKERAESSLVDKQTASCAGQHGVIRVASFKP